MSIILNNAFTRAVNRTLSHAITAGVVSIVAMDGAILGGYGGFYIGQALHSVASELPVVPDSFMSQTPEKYRQFVGQLNELVEDGLWAGGEVVDLIYQPSKDNWSFQPEWAD